VFELKLTPMGMPCPYGCTKSFVKAALSSLRDAARWRKPLAEMAVR